MEDNTEKTAKLEALQKMETTNVKKLDPVAGWMDIDRSKISYEGRLYPERYRFQVKAATTGTIKYFSTLDETNPMSVNDALSYVIEHHVRILDGSRALQSMDVIYEHDRFFFVMLVHMYSGAPTELSYSTVCTNSKCKHPQDVSITPYNIQFTELSNKALESITPSAGVFTVSTKTLGQRIFRPLTLAESGEITEFMMSSRRNGTEIEQFFLQVAPFLMFGKKQTDKIDDVYQKYLTLTDSPQEISLLAKISDEIDVRQLLELRTACTKCRLDFNSQIRTVAGIKHIFLVHNIIDELS